ncbi:MAG: YkuS family protein [Syntrophomonadaceae bacterium]|jgi:hypothetical protein
MSKIIAIDRNLTPFKEFLTQKGCQLVDLDAARNRAIDAVVLSGVHENLMGMEDIMIDAPVINAKGKTPEEVWDNITSRS